MLILFYESLSSALKGLVCLWIIPCQLPGSRVSNPIRRHLLREGCVSASPSPWFLSVPLLLPELWLALPFMGHVTSLKLPPPPASPRVSSKLLKGGAESVFNQLPFDHSLLKNLSTWTPGCTFFSSLWYIDLNFFCLSLPWTVRLRQAHIITSCATP